MPVIIRCFPVLLCLLPLALPFPAYAQEEDEVLPVPERSGSIGIAAGYNHAQTHSPFDSVVDNKPFEYLSSRSGFYAGVRYRHPLAGAEGQPELDLQGELLYSQKGGEYVRRLTEDVDLFDTAALYHADIEYRADYVELPIALRYSSKLVGRFSLHLTGGLYGAYLVNGKREEERNYTPISGPMARPARTEIHTSDLDIRSFEVGMLYGFGFGVELGDRRLELEVRISKDLMEAGEDGEIEIQHNVLSIGLGFI